MAIFPGSAIPSAVSDYEIDNSLRFENADTAYLTRTPTALGNRKTWTWSGWVKRGVLTDRVDMFGTASTGAAGGSGEEELRICFTDADIIQLGSDTGETMRMDTTPVYRDPSAWYHIVFAMDTTQATNTNRMKLYVNGEQVTALGTTNYPTQNLQTAVNYTHAHYTGASGSASSNTFDGYLAEVYFIDGTALAPSTFGELDSTTNQWIPLDSDDVKDAVTFGENGFYQKYNSTELNDSFLDTNYASPHTVTVTGNTHTDTTIKKVGTASAQFDGSGDSLDITDRVSDFQFGTFDFCIEFWMYMTSLTGTRRVFATNSRGSPYDVSGWLCTVNASGQLEVAAGSFAAQSWLFSLSSATSTIATGAWYHIALVKNGTAFNGYVNGVSKISTTISDSNALLIDPGTDGLFLGRWPVTGTDFEGYLDEIRVSKGAARYTGDFTAPTTAFTADKYTKLLLHCDGSDSGTNFTDDSWTGLGGPGHPIEAKGDTYNQRPQHHDVTANGEAHLIGPKIGSSTIAFPDGTSPYLSIADSSDFDINATSDWTWEFFVYRTVTDSASDALINHADGGGHGWNINWDGSNKVRIYNANDGSGGVTASNAIPINT